MELEEAFRKRARSSGGGGGGGCSACGPDRLSSLPDCLLHVIMSFMKARQAVQTCVLSKRWRHLWHSVPCLDIDFDEFKKTTCASDDNSGTGGNGKSGSGGNGSSGSGGNDNSDSDANDNSGTGRNGNSDFGDNGNSGSGGNDNSNSGGNDNSGSGGDVNSGTSGHGNSNSNGNDNAGSGGGVNSGTSGHGNSGFGDLGNSGSHGNNPDSGGDSYDSDSDPDIHDSDSNIPDSDRDTMSSYHSDKDEYKDWEDFEDFAVSLMHRCDIAQLDSFRLHIVGSRTPVFGYRHAAGWLRRMMKYCTPGRASQHVGLSSGSWRLKRLHLGHVHLDNRFEKHVSSVCHCLEELELENCTCEIWSITSHSLKILVLKYGIWCSLSKITSPTLKTLVLDGVCTGDHILVILAPAVAYLHLNVNLGHFHGGISIKELPFIAKASIYLEDYRYSVFSSKLFSDQFKLLCSISNVTSLELFGVGTMVLGEEPEVLEFKNLRSLLLDNCGLSNDFHTLVFFLQSSPVLEKLTLRRCEFPRYSDSKKGTPKLNKTSSSELCGLDLLCENLKVEIIYEYGYAPHLLELLLRVSVNLSMNNIKLTQVD